MSLSEPSPLPPGATSPSGASPSSPRGGRSRLPDAIAGAWLFCALALAATVLWAQDGRYGQPTPRPEDLAQAPLGKVLPWPPDFQNALSLGRPALLHFFNPDCPCSRFNLDHLRELQALHGSEIDLILVLECDRDPGPDFAIDGLPVPIMHDADGALADLAGVYSTPVAVILDRQHRLSYAGNYTISRFCNDPAGEPARRMLERLLGKAPADADSTPNPIEPPIPFGCQLPSDLIAESR